MDSVLNLTTGMRSRIHHIHFVGIGGIGMSGIAEVLLKLGYVVSGSDLKKNYHTERLTKLGIKIAYSHFAQNVAKKCNAIVFSSAISNENIEISTARKLGIPIIPRAVMLAELMRFKQGIAIAGTHGKTTTTSLIATIFTDAGLDPTFIAGGQINKFEGHHAKHGLGNYVIAEADESDASLLYLNPMISVVTNIDNDHMETYNYKFVNLCNTFLEFIKRLPFYGLAVLCIDDPVIRKILPQITRPYITYGFSKDADVQALNWNVFEYKTYFNLKVYSKNIGMLHINLLGKHNILNALAAIAVSLDAGIEFPIIQKCLMNFQGVHRRLQILGQYIVEGKHITLIDDYGHHPREVKAVIDAIRINWPKQRLIMIYQPHRYSRTKALFKDFTNILSKVDVLFILEVYSAGEKKTFGTADSIALCSSVINHGIIKPVFVSNQNKLFFILKKILNNKDIILTQGAGNIGEIAKDLTIKFANIKI